MARRLSSFMTQESSWGGPEIMNDCAGEGQQKTNRAHYGTYYFGDEVAKLYCCPARLFAGISRSKRAQSAFNYV
jgi:hypothetical protein